jgi:hypothetical protein
MPGKNRLSTWILVAVAALSLTGCRGASQVLQGDAESSGGGVEVEILDIDSSWVPFQWSLFGDTHLFSGDKKIRGARLNLLGGNAESLEGFELGLVGLTNDDTHGVQANAILNHCGDELHGMQVSAIANRTDDDVHGLQISGLFNRAGSDYHGLQVAGLLNEVGDDMHGIQIAGLGNNVGTDESKGWSEVWGVQAATLFNAGGASGVQIAGINGFGFSLFGDKGPQLGRLDGIQLGAINLALASNGVQLGALVNRASRLDGVQLGPLNTVERVSGVQIGLLNMADDLTGVQIGILNFKGSGFRGFVPVINIGN